MSRNVKLNFSISYFFFAALIPARYILSVLSSIGMAIIYGLKVNLSVAMVAMVNQTAIKATGGGDPHAPSVTLSNYTNPEECEAEPLKHGSSGDQVSNYLLLIKIIFGLSDFKFLVLK